MSTPEIGVGLLGTAFMGRAHALAYRNAAAMMAPALAPRLELVVGRDAGRADKLASAFGFRRSAGDWRALIGDDAVGLVDVCGPNHLHAEPAILAMQAGQHVLCEKPSGRDAAEALRMWEVAAGAGVVHMVGFNYRFAPAVLEARRLVEAGALGPIRHFRARYLQDWLSDPDAPASWRLNQAQAGAGAVGDLGSHIVDLARFLVGEIEDVGATVRTFVERRPGGDVDVDDAFAASVTFAGGAIGTLEASRVARGNANALAFEINGVDGSLRFALERVNELEVLLHDEESLSNGFRRVLVTDPRHRLLSHWWPPGHVLGWEHTFTHEVDHLLAAIAGGGSVTPIGADLWDGYRAALVCDAILRSAATGRRERVEAVGRDAVV